MSEMLMQQDTRRKPLTVEEIKSQVQVIQRVMREVMIKDTHYGTIPGTPKPTLYKPGSEKILATFHIAAYPKEVEDLSTDDEIRYRVKVHGLTIDGDIIGVGIGECSSSEEKYKWRKPACDAEYNETPDNMKREVWKKGNPPYKLKQVRTNPADVANTILKMAKKRAQIDMTLTATAASDVFDQDLEDMPDEIREGVADSKAKKAETKAPQSKSGNGKGEKATEETVNFIPSEVIERTTSTGKTVYDIVGPDGKYSTFSTTIAKDAREATATGLLIGVKYKVGQYGNTVVSVGPAVYDEEGEQEG